MNKKMLIIIISLCLVCNFYLLGLELYNNGKPHQHGLEEQPFVKGQIIIKIHGEAIGLSQSPASRDGLSGQYPGKMDNRGPAVMLIHKYHREIKAIKPAPFSIPGYHIVETREGCDIKGFKEQLQNDPLVREASLNYIAAVTGEPPDDEYFMYQYALFNYGQVYRPDLDLQGTTGSDIKAIDGWEWTTGGEEIIIAVADSGVASDHEDLVNKVTAGYNFIDDNDNPYDDHGHGTFVASIAAANTNNGVGMAGVSWHAKIMPVKVMSYEGYGSYLVIAAGIRYAADHGAHIINLSIGGSNPSFILEDACWYAFDRGSLVVASTGNTGSYVLYPAGYDDYCLAVAATDDDDKWAPWSNNGPQVDVAAPGWFVFGAFFSPQEPGKLDNYGWGSGTSFSAPYVAGAAALLMHYKPFLNHSQVMDLIRYTADDINRTEHPGVDDYLGYGRINLGTLLGPYEL
jgi:subtilisin family serine protease